MGYLTNLIALKLIFEPVEPTRIGPFMLQGMFLKRQHEVSEEFADCMTERLLSSETLWHNILTGSGADRFAGASWCTTLRRGVAVPVGVHGRQHGQRW